MCRGRGKQTCRGLLLFGAIRLKDMGAYDLIRTPVYQNYIRPARHRGAKTVAVIAGKVHDELGYVDRIVFVCDALSANKFRTTYDLKLLGRTGKKFGREATFIFGI